MNGQAPQELVEQISKGNCLLILGSELYTFDVETEQLPSDSRIARRLADRCSFPEPDYSLSRVAQYYELENGRQALIQQLREIVDASRDCSPSVFRVIARLPFKTIVSTNFDGLLEREMTRQHISYSLVLGNEDVAYLDDSKPLIVKLRGWVEVPSSIIITEDDHLQFFQRFSAISLVIRALFATKTLLFVGYDLSDPNFRQMYVEIMASVDRHRRKAYAVQGAPRAYEVRAWSNRNLEVICGTPLDFLTDLAARLDALPPRQRPQHVAALWPERPYKFLDYFEAQDELIFHGRDYDVDLVLKRILARKFTVLYGPSGCGKTSLIRAAIIPRASHEGYESIYVRALGDPLFALKRQIVGRSYGANQTSERGLESVGLDEVLASVVEPGTRLLLVLDQFEEFFLRYGTASRRSFMEELAKATKQSSVDLRVLFSLRDDYFVNLDEFEEIVPTVFGNKYRLGNLDEERSRLAITEPALLFGLHYEPELVEQMIDDLAEGGFEPTQIQIVCHRLYQGLSTGQAEFTLSDYAALGGAEGILSRYLDEVLDSFSAHDRDVARSVLKSMVTADARKEALSGQEIARDAILRRLSVPEEQLNLVLAKLRDSRIIRKLVEPELFELAHEVLVKKVWRWVTDEDVAAKYVRSVVRQALADWRRLGLLVDPEKWQLIRERKEILSVSPEEEELLLRTAIEKSDEMGYWCVRGNANGLEVWRILENILESGSPRSRYNAVSLLQELNDERRLSLLGLTLNSEYPAVVRLAWRILQTIDSDRAREICGDFVLPPSMILVEAGDCIIGQDVSPMQEPTEEPAHRVEVPAFWLSRFPVTNIEYMEFVLDEGRTVPDHWVGGSYPAGKADHPVVYVSWHDAMAYCAWLSAKSGVSFRLPTEAEWEKAASWNPELQSRTIFPYGDDFDSRKCNTAESGIGDTTPIGEFAASGGDSWYGISDLAGNMWEWCSTRATDEKDKVVRYPYNAKDGRENPAGAGMRVVRGGSFNYSSRASRASSRSMRDPSYRGWHYGFRVARDQRVTAT